MKNQIILLLLFFSLIFLSCKDNAAEEVNMNDDELKNNLTPLQYHVTQENGTEPPFENEFWNNKRAGIYVDIISGEPLFSSLDKFDSGTGWPSFYKPLEADNIVEETDKSHFMARTEVRSKDGDSHLGHVFDDGPNPTGLRYCINSASLRFIPAEDLEKEGYGEYLKLFKKDQPIGSRGNDLKYQLAGFGAGCFWGVEHIYKSLDGVIETTVGYMGGHTTDPTYEDVSSGKTGHAETVLIKYDPDQVSYETLLDYFFRMHDPTTPNQQGPNYGSQYRSIIFYYNEDQKVRAEKFKDNFDKSKVFKNKAATEIVKAYTFYDAEYYHQDYIDSHPYYVCHTLRDK